MRSIAATVFFSRAIRLGLAGGPCSQVGKELMFFAPNRRPSFPKGRKGDTLYLERFTAK